LALEQAKEIQPDWKISSIWLEFLNYSPEEK